MSLPVCQSTIDYVWVSLKLVKFTVCVEVPSIVGSDHLPVESKLSLKTGIVGKTNVVRKSNDYLEKKIIMWSL